MTQSPTNADDGSTSPRPASGRRRITFKRVVLAFLCVLLISAGVVYWLWQSKPASFYEHRAFLDSTTAEQRRQLAEEVEHLLSSRLSHSGRTHIDQTIPAPGKKRPDPFGVRKMTITLDQARAWLDLRLESVLREAELDWPQALRSPTIVLEDGQLRLAGMIDTPQLSQWVTVLCKVHLQEDRARLTLNDARAGRLPLPNSTVIKVLRSNGVTPRMAKAITAAFERGHSFDPVVLLPGDRRGRLLSYEIEADRMHIEFRIEPIEGSN